MEKRQKPAQQAKKAPQAKKRPVVTKREKTRKSAASPENAKKEEQLRTTLAKERALQALEARLGVVEAAARDAGIASSTFRLWIKEDPEFAAKVAEIKATALDFVEDKMFAAIKAWKSGAAQLVQFYLKTQGKERGYVERQEVVNVPSDHVVIEYKKPE
jgi:hypothetical protein